MKLLMFVFRSARLQTCLPASDHTPPCLLGFQATGENNGAAAAPDAMYFTHESKMRKSSTHKALNIVNMDIKPTQVAAIFPCRLH